MTDWTNTTKHWFLLFFLCVVGWLAFTLVSHYTLQIDGGKESIVPSNNIPPFIVTPL